MYLEINHDLEMLTDDERALLGEAEKFYRATGALIIRTRTQNDIEWRCSNVDAAAEYLKSLNAEESK